MGSPFPTRIVAVAACLALLVGGAIFAGNGPSAGADSPFAPGLEPHAILRTSHGDIEVALYEQLVPLTVGRFTDLAQAGRYDGTTVDRIVKGYDVQMGDPASGGHPLPVPIPDEFHPALRHDRPGTVSMATAGPDSGTGAFFITTAPAPGFDDRYSVFGRVVGGMEVVQAIEALPIEGTSFGPPQEEVRLLGVTVVPAPAALATARHGAAVTALTAEKTADPAAGATFALVVTNTGAARDVLSLEVEVPLGWTASFENPRVALPAGRGWVVLLHAVPDSLDSSPADLLVRVASEADPSRDDSVLLRAVAGRFGPRPTPGTNVTVEYTVLLPDGRLAETTRDGLGDGLVRMSSLVARDPSGPVEFTLGQAPFPGVDHAVAATWLGETSAVRVPAANGQAALGSLLAGRDLVVEATIVAAYT
jgi:cyclophilin family peptidyl-prolyl cis-trans isomerase